VKRREFITLIGGAAATWPLAARAQQPAMALVGLLTGNQLDDRWLSAVGQGLKEVGYIEGRNAAIKYRSAGGRFDRLPALATELVADPVAVIVTLTPAAALAAKAATRTIPIIFTTGADPVDLGLVSSLNHPGGNVTGISFLINTLESKRLELARDLLPSATVVGFLVNPTNPASQSQTRDAQVAAGALGLKLVVFNAKNEGEIDAAFTSLVEQRVKHRDRGRRWILLESTRSTGRASCAPCNTCHLFFARTGDRWRLNELRNRHCGCITPRWRLCGQNS
jgi:putative ABC transport system substrate-binding protein